MAGWTLQSPVLLVRECGPGNGELRGCKVELGSVSGRGMPGMRPPNSLDGMSSGKPFRPGTCRLGGRARSSRVPTVAEFGEKTSELVIESAKDVSPNGQDEDGSIPGFEKVGRSVPGREVPLEGDRGGAGKSSAGGSTGIDAYRPGSGKGADGLAAPVARKRRDKGVRVDRWVPPGSKLHCVKQILERLGAAESTNEAVAAAMEGWDAPIHPRDMTSVISNLRWKKARAFFNWLQSQGYELNVVTCNVLLGAFRTGKVWNMAEEFAEQMLEDGLKMDNYTYSTLISCALQCNAPQDALKWFDKMHEAGCVPDEVTYGNMALVYSRLGRFDDAVGLYERMRETGWKPDKISFGTMVNVYSRGGNYFKASGVIREMQQAGLQPEAVVYNTLIRYFAREGKIGQAKKVFQDMERAGVKPSEFTFSLMIDVHGRAGESREAFEFFERMKEENMPLDVVVYNSLLKMCAEERLVGEAENLLEGMTGRGIRPDFITYKSMINLYAKEGRVEEAEKFANKMVERGISLDVVVYSCLIRGCGIAKDFVGAGAFFGKMLAAGCPVDDKCCGILLSLLIMCRTDEDRAIMIGCLEQAKPELSEVVNLLLEEDFRPDALDERVQKLLSVSEQDSHRPFCNALVDFCWNLDKKDRARSVLALADNLGVYPGGLRTKTLQLWVLHLRSLSFCAAECGLDAWLDHLREQLDQGVEFPQTLVIETGAGRNREDVVRLFNVILRKVAGMGAPFEPSPERPDWIQASGFAMAAWMTASGSQVPD